MANFLRLPKGGSLELNYGPMGSGKTWAMYENITRLDLRHSPYLLVKPKRDTRDDGIRSRAARQEHRCYPVEDSSALEKLVRDKREKYDVKALGIDEIHFFDDGLISVLDSLRNEGMNIFCAGLDMDYLAQPFNITRDLHWLADLTVQHRGHCQHIACSNPSTHSALYRNGVFATSGNSINVEDVRNMSERYVAFCRRCYHTHPKEEDVSFDLESKNVIELNGGTP